MKFVQRIFTFLIAATEISKVAKAQVSVPITIPVTIPFTVPEGQSFHSAAEEFCQRNGLEGEQASILSKALEQEWQRIQTRNRITRCFKWQRRYAVAPQRSWGSMPDDTRIQWLELFCDTVVPDYPPNPQVTLMVELYDTKVPLDYYEGDDLQENVNEFCAAHGVDVQQNGPMLLEALQKNIQAFHVAKAEKAQREASSEQQQPAAHLQEEQPKDLQSPSSLAAGTFLFAIPVNIDNKEVELRVHEGDEMGPLVQQFCEQHGISLEQHGNSLKKSIMDTLVNLQMQLLEQMKSKTSENSNSQPTQPVVSENSVASSSNASEVQQQMQEQQRKVVFTVPITLDGKAIPMDLLEGDNLSDRVSQFCMEHGIKEEEIGNTLRMAVLEQYRAFQQSIAVGQ